MGGYLIQYKYQNFDEDIYGFELWGYGTDTCNGNNSGTYFCPADIGKTCRDQVGIIFRTVIISSSYRTITCKRARVLVQIID